MVDDSLELDRLWRLCECGDNETEMNGHKGEKHAPGGLHVLPPRTSDLDTEEPIQSNRSGENERELDG